MNIAILEDNPLIREFMRTLLDMEGYTVSTYSSGISLLAALSTENKACADLPYDLVITDLGLCGELSGQEVITVIKHCPSLAALPIIVVSASSEHELEQVQEGLHIPCLHKPFRPEALFQLIAHVVPIDECNEPEDSRTPISRRTHASRH